MYHQPIRLESVAIAVDTERARSAREEQSVLVGARCLLCNWCLLSPEVSVDLRVWPRNPGTRHQEIAKVSQRIEQWVLQAAASVGDRAQPEAESVRVRDAYKI